MVLAGCFPMQAENTVPMFLGWCMKPVLMATECSNCDQTRYRPSTLRATRHAQVSGPTGGPNHFRCIDRQPRSGRAGRTAKLWDFSDQTATRSHREESSHGRGSSSRITKLGKFQARQRDGGSRSAVCQARSNPASALSQAASGPTRSWQRQNMKRVRILLKKHVFFSGFLHRDNGRQRLQTEMNQSLGPCRRSHYSMNFNHPCVLGTRRKTG